MKPILFFFSFFFLSLLYVPVFGQDNRLKVAGSIQTDSVLSGKFIMTGGTPTQILTASGSVVTLGSGLSISNGQLIGSSSTSIDTTKFQRNLIPTVSNGTSMAIVAGSTKDTLKIPLAGTSVSGGLLSNSTQNIAGDKTFLNNVSYRYQSATTFRDFNNNVDEWVLSRNGGDPNFPGNNNPQSYFQLKYYPFNTFIGTPAYLELSPNGDLYTSGKLAAAGGFVSYGKAFYTNEGYRSGTNTDTTSFNQVLIGRSPGTIIQGGSIVASGNLNTRGNITGNNLSTAGIISGGSLNTTGAITAGTNLTVGGNISSSGTVTGTQFIRSGGTASQFLMANGTVKRNSFFETIIARALYTKSADTLVGIGINTTSPRAFFEINGTGYDMRKIFRVSSANDVSLNVNNNSTNYSYTGVTFQRNNTERAFFGLIGGTTLAHFVMSAAKVGIGTSNPSATLHVNGTIRVDSSIKISSSGNQLVGSDGKMYSLARGLSLSNGVLSSFIKNLSLKSQVGFSSAINLTAKDELFLINSTFAPDINLPNNPPTGTRIILKNIRATGSTASRILATNTLRNNEGQTVSNYSLEANKTMAVFYTGTYWLREYDITN